MMSVRQGVFQAPVLTTLGPSAAGVSTAFSVFPSVFITAMPAKSVSAASCRATCVPLASFSVTGVSAVPTAESAVRL